MPKASRPEPPTLVSQAEFARLCGVSRKTVSLWKSKGYVLLDASGQVDVGASNRKLSGRGDRYRGGVTKGPR